MTVIGARKVLLRNDPNPYWHGKKPIVLAQTRPDLFEMQGIPETELVDHLQQAQWTLQNMTIDNLHLTTMRGITYREGGITNPEALQLRPRFKWPVVDHDDIRPFEIQPIGSDVYQERQRLLSDMQLVTGINPYISGSDLQSVDQNTATGVTALQEVASASAPVQGSRAPVQGLPAHLRDVGRHDPAVHGPAGVRADHRPQGGSRVAEREALRTSPVTSATCWKEARRASRRQQERGEAIALLNAFAPLAQLGIVNFKPILERVGLAYDFPNPEAALPSPANPAGGGPDAGADRPAAGTAAATAGAAGLLQHPGREHR